jgi:hypothetical protein
MPSRILPMAEIEQLGTQFWLPAGGHHNGVEATQWAVIAELERPEVSPALRQLAAADVGGYAVTIAARATRGDTRHRLYVDAQQYNVALDALMIVMRGKQNRDLGGYVPSKRQGSGSASIAATPGQRSLARIAVRVGRWLLGGAVIAVLLAAGYQAFVHRYPPVHARPHYEQNAPGIQQAPATPVP